MADVTKERDRLATKVKTLERELATLRKAKPAAQPAEAVERPEGAEAPPGDKGGASAAGVRYLLAGAQAWHAQAEACAGQMSAVSTGLRMAMMASGKQVNVDSVAPDAPKVTAAGGSAPAVPPPPPHVGGHGPLLCGGGGGVELPCRAPLAGALLQGGGGAWLTLYPRDHLSFLTTTNVILPPPPPPKHGQFDQHVGHSPPTLRNFLQHCLYIIRGMLCPLTCLRYFLRHCLYFIWGMLCPLTCYTAD